VQYANAKAEFHPHAAASCVEAARTASCHPRRNAPSLVTHSATLDLDITSPAPPPATLIMPALDRSLSL
jgi:hypothetical protein